MPDNPPLKGIRVLDVGTLTPGKYCTFLLAELGAEVIHVERPARDPGPVSNEDLLLNKGKKSLTLNLRSDEAVTLLRGLVGKTDVLIESYRPGVAARLGIDYDTIRLLNDRVIYCSLSGFGQNGPDSQRPAYDLLFMAMSGALDSLHGEGAPHSAPRAFVADAASGIFAALAVTTALFARERGGTGCYVDLAMFDCARALLAVSHGTEGESGVSAGDDSEGYARDPLYNIYRTANGYLALAAAEPAPRTALFDLLKRPELADTKDDDKIKVFLTEAFSAKSADEWVQILKARDIPAGPVASPGDAMDDPQLIFRGMSRDTAHPLAGRLRQIASPLHFGPSAANARPAPVIGQDTDEILATIGCNPEEIERLRSTKVI
jgi:crotonobetainyl-CoA:carnitine CoA-transferase CaiB-like acyl-CoA transferase